MTYMCVCLHLTCACMHTHFSFLRIFFPSFVYFSIPHWFAGSLLWETRIFSPGKASKDRAVLSIIQNIQSLNVGLQNFARAVALLAFIKGAVTDAVVCYSCGCRVTPPCSPHRVTNVASTCRMPCHPPGEISAHVIPTTTAAGSEQRDPSVCQPTSSQPCRKRPSPCRNSYHRQWTWGLNNLVPLFLVWTVSVK